MSSRIGSLPRPSHRLGLSSRHSHLRHSSLPPTRLRPLSSPPRSSLNVKEEPRTVEWPIPPLPPSSSTSSIRASLQEEKEEWKDIDDATIMWFLRDRRGDAAAATEKLRAMLKWRESLGGGLKTTFPFSLIEEEAKTNKACVHNKRDRWGRPVLLVQTRHHVIDEFKKEESQRLTAYYLDKAVEMVEEEGEEEGVLLGIFDLRGFKARNADLSYARFLIDVFFKFYPRRLGRVLFVDAPLVFYPPWQIIKPLLGKYAQLVRFVSSSELREYFEKEEDMPEIFMR